MKALTSYKDLLQASKKNNCFCIAHLYEKEKLPILQHPDYCELYYAISGALTFRIDEKNYRIEPGNVFLINQYENRQITQLDTRSSHERIIAAIHPAYLKAISSPATDLSYCFSHRPRKFSHCLPLTSGQQRRFLYYINRITTAEGYGSDLIEQCSMTELLLFLTLLCKENSIEPSSAKLSDAGFNHKIAEITSYIHQNIELPLSVESIASHFYLSGPYLCRLFKKCTGKTINAYIVTHRITLAKSWLEDGYGVNEVCGMCGFNDYSNFYKAFKKNVGISPKKYSQNCLR